MSKQKKPPETNNDDVSLDDGVEFQKVDLRKGRSGRKFRYPFPLLVKAGQSFFVPNTTKRKMYQYVFYANRSGKAQFSFGWDYCRKIENKWKQCKKEDEGATLGIRVKRVK